MQSRRERSGSTAPSGAPEDAAKTPAALSFEEVATELYGLPLTEFTARRDERAREARAAGDRGLADQLKSLRRPTLAAWLANQLVRERPEEIQALLALGEGLREATAALEGEQLRELDRQQRQVLAAMVGQARAIAKGVGQRVSEDAARGVEDTLRAALADTDAGEALAGGRLTAALMPPAFGGLMGPELTLVSPGKNRPARAARSESDQRAARLKQARVEARAAAEEAERAEAARRAAEESADGASQEVRQADHRVEKLQAQLAEATEDQTAAKRAATAAREILEHADQVASAAQLRLARAEAEVESLDG